MGKKGLAAVAGFFSVKLRKERRQAEVVILSPAIERMIVTLGTLNAHAQPKLRRRLAAIARIGGATVEIGLRDEFRASPRATMIRRANPIQRYFVRNRLHQKPWSRCTPRAPDFLPLERNTSAN